MRDIVLIGADDVRRAGNTISSAAELMSRTQGYEAEELQRHRIFMDEWLQRFENALQSHVDQLRDLKEE